MKKLIKIGLTLTVALALAAPVAMAMNHMPGEGVTLTPGRATWNTGFFQEALVRRGLEALGYKVKAPKDLQNPIFYKSVSLGDVDYWTTAGFFWRLPRWLKPAVCRDTWSPSETPRSTISNRWMTSKEMKLKKHSIETGMERPI